MTEIISARCENCKKPLIEFESGWELEVPNVRHAEFGHESNSKCKTRVRIWYKEYK